MKTLVMAMAVLVSAFTFSCKHAGNRATSELRDETDRAPPSYAVGVYELTFYYGTTNILQRVRKIEVKHTPNGRSGEYSFVLLDGRDEIVKTWGGDFHEFPSSGYYYLYFAGLDGAIHYDDRGGEVEITRINGNQQDVFQLRRISEIPDIGGGEMELPDDSQIDLALMPWGCHNVESHTGTTPGPVERVCIRSTPAGRSGPVTFVFEGRRGTIQTWVSQLANAQPRCPGCFALHSMDGSTLTLLAEPGLQMSLQRLNGDDYDFIEFGRTPRL